MSATGLRAFDATLQLTNTWLHDLMDELGWSERERAYHALRAVLHALRDRLPHDAAAALGAQLPLLVRGLFYEGWRPAATPLKGPRREALLAELVEAFPDDRDIVPDEIARAVFRVMGHHVSAGEMAAVRHVLPARLQELWP